MSTQTNPHQSNATNHTSTSSFPLYAFLVISTIIFVNAGIWAVVSSGLVR